ncbi:MAG: hypothetical protein IT337_15440 [Thermomicrobiales bacterium]|nr:hypothetical protein [Thermomicrobiales bacterium]
MSDLIVNRWEDGARMPDLTFRAVVFGDDHAALAESDSTDALAAWEWPAADERRANGGRS